MKRYEKRPSETVTSFVIRSRRRKTVAVEAARQTLHGRPITTQPSLDYPHRSVYFANGAALHAMARAGGSFASTDPFPWVNLSGFLTAEGFEELCANFPPLELFEKHVGGRRPHGQRPHNRYYLAFESSIYHDGDVDGPGVARKADLPVAWQGFLDELAGDDYRGLITSCLGVDRYDVRYAWHVGEGGSEVSAHVDTPDKVGTHIFYFNRAEEWNPEWGGATLVLGGKTTEAMNPEFDDFPSVVPVDTVGNMSLLVKNTPEAWHGVRALDCPPGAHRRLFNVIVEHPGADEERQRRTRPSVIARGKSKLRLYLGGPRAARSA